MALGDDWVQRPRGEPLDSGGDGGPQQQPGPTRPIAGPTQQTNYGGATVGPSSIFTPGAKGSFAAAGLGKYYTRNENGRQFNKPAILGAVRKGVQAYSEAQYFRHAGVGAAARHMLGMPQMPSHMNDYLRSRHNTDIRGINPHSLDAQFGMQDPHEYEHF